MTETFDRILIDPTPAERDAALSAAVVTANARFRIKCVTWPPPDFADFLAQLARDREGMRGWHGGKKPNYWEGRSQVVAVWWTDHLGRKHLRVLGGPGGTLCLQMRFRAPGLSSTWLSAVEQVYPQYTGRYARGGPPHLVALCDCGAVGAPDALGWMGQRCGPCHDRQAAGEGAPPPLVIRAGETCLEVAFAPDSGALAVGVTEGGVQVRDSATGAVEQLPFEVDLVRALAYAAGGRRLVVVDDNAVMVWDTRRRKANRWDLASSTWASALSPDGTMLAASGAVKGTVEIRSTEDGQLLRTVEASEGESTSGNAFSADGRLLATASYKSPLRVWEASTGRLVREFADDLHPSSLAFSPDGALLAGASLVHGGVRLWDVARGVALPAPPPFPAAQTHHCVAFAPAGRFLIAGRDHGALSLWDLEAGGERLDLQWVDGCLLCLASSPDGRWLAVGDNTGTVRLWPWPALHALLARPRETAERRLT
jgi:hypothetical protein